MWFWLLSGDVYDQRCALSKVNETFRGYIPFTTTFLHINYFAQLKIQFARQAPSFCDLWVQDYLETDYPLKYRHSRFVGGSQSWTGTIWIIVVRASNGHRGLFYSFLCLSLACMTVSSINWDEWQESQHLEEYWSSPGISYSTSGCLPLLSQPCPCKNANGMYLIIMPQFI